MNQPIAQANEAAAPTTTASDEELVMRYRDHHDQAAFDALVHRYERELYSYLRRYTGDEGLAEDVFQATFVKLHQKCHLFEPHRRVRPWLYSIATHQAIDALRSAGRRQAQSLDAEQGRAEQGTPGLVQLLVDRSPSPLDQLEARERKQWLHAAVDRLPEELRSVLILAYFQGLKYREVAEVLGIPLGTVKSRMHAALARLTAAWKESHGQSTE